MNTSLATTPWPFSGSRGGRQFRAARRFGQGVRGLLGERRTGCSFALVKAVVAMKDGGTR
jgi:hypothetical protein